MKWIRCTGRVLEVRDVGPVLMRLRAAATGQPVAKHVDLVETDDEARARVRALLDAGAVKDDR